MNNTKIPHLKNKSSTLKRKNFRNADINGKGVYELCSDLGEVDSAGELDLEGGGL